MNGLDAEFDCDVAIVGGGPVGLVLANLLGLQGVRTRVIERTIHPVQGSMAIGVTPPSLEILRRLGLDLVFERNGVRVRFAEVFERGRPLGRLDFGAIPSDYRYYLSIPQSRTIEILRNHTTHSPSVTLETGVEFIGLDQDDHGVSVRTARSNSEGSSSFRCRYLAGCDGHRSVVREAAGIRIVQRHYRQRFLMGDFEDASGLGDEARLFFGPEASVESFPLPGGLRRWILLVEESRHDLTLRHLVGRIRDLTGHSLSTESARFLSGFGAKRLEVDRYNRGRVLLAGDAAHVMSSVGGQGMNTGFADAEYLAGALCEALRNPENASHCFAAYDRVRRRAFRVAARRAECSMWLGTSRGRLVSWFRKHFIRDVLFSPIMAPRLAPYFAMLTVPFRTLSAVPQNLSPMRMAGHHA